jgi:2-dehydro-3-deoxyphosphogluconate aldolase/(4S)-4-hydroxy-2-oxoglutarate aldolase
VDNVLDVIKDNRIVIVYRGMQPEECLEASRALMEAGIRLFEVTMNSPDTTGAIELLKAELGPEALLGAGTVTRTDQVDAVADHGASYIISSNTNTDVIRRTKELGLISIPGAFSPTEIMTAWEAGADMVKVFPINVVGAEYITQLRGPIDQVPFMVTGGIKLEMVKDLFRAGSDAIGISVQLLGKDLVESRDWQGLRSRAEKFMEAAGVQALR